MFLIDWIARLVGSIRDRYLQTWGRSSSNIEQDASLSTTQAELNCSHQPAIRVTNLQFSDGKEISIGNTDVVVFVGPNNAGKSQALRDIQRQLSDNLSGIVVSNAKFEYFGSAEELENYVQQHSVLDISDADPYYKGYNFSLPAEWLTEGWLRHSSIFASMFCMEMSTQTRLQSSDPVRAIASLNKAVEHPIQMLYQDDSLEARISAYFFRAFGAHLIVHRLGGSEIPLLVGQPMEPEDGEDRLSISYIDRLLKTTVSLQEQGDGMRSFASVILHLLAPITPSILLLDEPEVFLHPPQARLLGEILAMERSNRAQLFVATHSADVLQGLLNVVDADHLRVIRIEREDDVNQVKELDRNLAREISKDPLMKYSSVLSGVFHKRVIICESDADCMFYSSLLDISSVHRGPFPDVLFIHANGKHRVAKQAGALVALGVRVDVIIDMDILQGEDDLRKLFDALGGNWSDVMKKASSVRKVIQGRRVRDAGAISKKNQ
ncbi:MAG: AAA family ATPase [Caldilineaceae bacterium]|nr:AAA family ATPase [Caldilineaceae bacterium]